MSSGPAQVDYPALLKEGYLQLKALQARLDALERARAEPIAVVGLGCRFPGGGDNPRRFWRMLCGGVDAVRAVPPERWDIDAYYDPDPVAPGKMYTRSAAFLERVDLFDAGFFGIAPREAENMDPQQRLLLEVAWEALEDAALPPRDLVGSATGVFVGVMFYDYGHLIASGDPRSIDTYSGTGNGVAFLAGRLSYHLGLQGPSLVLDTACSSSLVTVHLACQSLRGGECDLALAAGVNLIISPVSSIVMCKLRALSPDGRCKTFDASADGYGRGEGCGVVVLKRLADALAAGDRIYALIRGSAVNQDGPSAGMTVPNGLAQQAVIRRALAAAGIRGEQVSYVEAHGTGTRLGDPLELHSTAAVLRGGQKGGPLLVGSLKTNVGHLEGAAGVGGLIKTALALQHGQIPPHLHLKELNPIIAQDRIAVRIPIELMDWPAPAGERVAGVSSFGLSGTNAHVVLSEAPRGEPANGRIERPLHLLGLSAKSARALDELLVKYREHLGENPDEALADICYTAAAGRTHFEHRLAVVAESVPELGRILDGLAAGRQSDGVWRGSAASGDAPKVALRFAEHGSLDDRSANDVVLQAPAPEGDKEVWRSFLEELAAWYVNGAEVDWRGFYQDQARRKIALPTYPFQRQRYWLESLTSNKLYKPAERAESAENWLYAVQWAEKEPPPGGGDLRGRWLIFADRGGVGEQLAGLLESRGGGCILIDYAEGDRREAMGRRRLEAGRPDDFGRLLKETPPAGVSLRGVVYLWGLEGGREVTADALQTAQRIGGVGLLHLAQALAGQPGERSFRLWVVTRGTQAAESEHEEISPVHAPLWGLSKVIALEHPQWWGGLIDLPAAPAPADASSILAEISSSDGEEQVAYRGGRRLAARLVRRLDSLPAEAVKLREDGTYLITGGLGALGLQLAHWLVEGGARRLVLQSRRGLPPRETWPSLSPADDAVYQRVSAVRALEELGAEVEAVAADVSAGRQMEELFERLAGGERPLRGLIHAAGVSSVKPLIEMSAQQLQDVLAAKVQGTWHLHRLTGELDLDFFVCFSSIASVWGSQGLAHYAAANQFLDAYARYRRRLGRPALSINWGPWVGGGLGWIDEQARLSRVGIRGLPPAAALAILGRLMNTDAAAAVVADIDWSVFKAVYQAQRPRPLLEKISTDPKPAAAGAGDEETNTRNQILSAPPRAQRPLARDYLRRQLARVMKLPESALDVSRPLNTLGVDSLMAMELQNRIEGQLQAALPVASFLQGRSLEQLADELLDNLAAEASPTSPGKAALPAGESILEGEL